PARRIAGDETKSARDDTHQWSWASAPANGNTQRSRGTPAASAAPAEQTISAAAWSVWMLAFISFGYGKPIMRLSSVTVRISSAVRASGNHAYGLPAATALKRAHRSEIRT